VSATLPLHRFRAKIADALRRVQRGETIIVTKNGKPVAEVRAAPQARPGMAEALRSAGLTPPAGPLPRPRRFIRTKRNIVEELIRERQRDQ
jgi:antitoxin (DNA-binding transcriptional repressor) of toxin-antitoxin stability system